MDSLINFEYEAVESLLRSFLWPFFRISGMLMSMVIIGSFIVSRAKRVALAFTITLVVAPVLPPMPVVELISFDAFIITINQLIIGIAVGFVSRLVFETFIVGGQIIAMSSGLGFAQINDPSSGVTVPAVGQFFLMMATLIFLAVDGHLMMFEIIIRSFDTLPVSTKSLPMESIAELISFAGMMFSAGLMMALAAVISLLLVNLAFGILTKVAPTLNIFVIGFPIILTFGLLILWFTISGFMPHFNKQMQRGQETMCNIVLMECGHG
ncbi:MAG: flagellar biosynthetic protein FliR [Gammaproteobacteria bacterium]|nr:MAG: flagellar biosynthetic protein FliR [Gammaproteobacteria bacterium]